MNYPRLPSRVTTFTKAGHYTGPCRKCGEDVHYHYWRDNRTVDGITYRKIEHVTCRKFGTAFYGAVYRGKVFNTQVTPVSEA